MTIKLPDTVRRIIESLERGGFEACAVGGCVRDSLLGRAVHDWDLATSARPEEVKGCFPDGRILETGLKHGTVTLLLEGRPYEITTYRIDGSYSDGRRPDSVAFTDRLPLDLARRDFTVNAMAYHPGRGLIDCFGGLDDLRAGRISCVGEPERRFEEDALRILRAVRFSAVLDFSIAPETHSAMEKLCPLLDRLAAERINGELSRTLTGRAAGRALLENSRIVARIMPELAPAMGFDQRNPHHCLDVWEHSVRALESAPPELPVRLALLLHDAAKPLCCTEDEEGVRHFYGHAAESAGLAEQLLRRLRYDNKTARLVTELVRRHDLPLDCSPKTLRRRLHQYGADFLRQLIEVQRADCLAQAVCLREERLRRLDAVSAALEEILQQAQCFSLKDLAVGGGDLLALGLPAGPGLGALLDSLLCRVLDGALPNERGALLAAARAEIAGQDNQIRPKLT